MVGYEDYEVYDSVEDFVRILMDEIDTTLMIEKYNVEGYDERKGLYTGKADYFFFSFDLPDKKMEELLNHMYRYYINYTKAVLGGTDELTRIFPNFCKAVDDNVETVYIKLVNEEVYPNNIEPREYIEPILKDVIKNISTETEIAETWLKMLGYIMHDGLDEVYKRSTHLKWKIATKDLVKGNYEVGLIYN